MKQFKLPKEFAEKWLIALRSGEYIQGEEQLVSIIQDDKGYYICQYCCLGVAGKISGMTIKELDGNTLFDVCNFDEPENLEVPKELIGDNNVNLLVGILTTLNDGVSPGTYKDRFKKLDLVFRHFDIHQHYSNENQTEYYRLNFNQIADFIEDNCEFYEEKTIKKEIND